MNDPQAIRYVNEVIRPMAERMRSLKQDIDSATTSWFGGLNAIIPNTSAAIEDGREAQGVSRLVGSDVVNLLTQMLAIQTQLNQGGVADVISKPCVRFTRGE